MTSPLCVATGGWCRRVFHYRPPTLDFVQLVDGVGDIAELKVDSDGDFLLSGSCPRHWKSPGVEQQPRMRELGYNSKLCTKSSRQLRCAETPRHSVPSYGRFPRLYRLKCVKSSFDVSLFDSVSTLRPVGPGRIALLICLWHVLPSRDLLSHGSRKRRYVNPTKWPLLEHRPTEF